MFLWFWINETEHITRSFITGDRRRYRTQSWSGNTPRRRRKGRTIKWPRDANSWRWDHTKAENKITQILKTVPDNFSSLSVADYFNHLRHFLCVLPSQKTRKQVGVFQWKNEENNSCVGLNSWLPSLIIINKTQSRPLTSPSLLMKVLMVV